MEYLAEFGYIGLFVAAFLAATILPLSSEIVLTALLHIGLPPTTLVIVATTGNVVGSLINYAIGYWAGKKLAKRWLKVSDDDFRQSKQRLEKYGLFSLLFAWVPVVGDPLTVIAGVLRIKLVWFIILVTAGKLSRYIVITYIFQQSL